MIDGSKIRALRLAKSWTQFDLAKASDVQQSTISKIENGVLSYRDLTGAAGLARALGVQIEDLLGEPEPAAVE